jgi:P-type Cu+ transporter
MNASTTATTATDPICGMTIDPATAAGTSTRDGETVYFCSRPCKSMFDAAQSGVATCGCSTAC